MVSFLLVVCSLLAVSNLGLAANEPEFPQTMTFSMALRIDKTDWLAAKKEMAELLKFAREKKMTQNTIMFVRTASDKITSTLTEFNKIKKERAAMAAQAAAQAAVGKEEPAVFTTVAGPTPDFNKDYGVKSLKSSGAKKKNVLRYRASEVPYLLEKGKIDLEKPFLVTDGVNNLDILRRTYTGAKLLANKDVKLRYLSPVKAKARRSFDKQQSDPNEEMEWQLISTEKYFVNCFNLKGKPDFRRLGGAQTEHCEMTVPATALNPNATGLTLKPVAALEGFKVLEDGRNTFVRKADSLQPLVDERINIKSHLSQSASSFFTFGPSGSGEQLKQDAHSFVDGLIHGKRRWFLMRPKDFMDLRKTASEILEPASSFMFFEQQLEELIEDHELGTDIPFYDANQLPGDLIYIPSGLVVTGLNMVDSISYRQHTAPSSQAVADSINQNIWFPESGQVPAGFQFGLCNGFDLDKAGTATGKKVHPNMGAQVSQIMKQFFPTPASHNHLIVEMLSACFATMTGKLQGTYCSSIWKPCVQQLEKNAKTMKAKLPAWLGKTYEDTYANIGKGSSTKTEL